MSKFIPLSEPHINGNEWKYVKECLDTGWVSSVGKFVDAFESKIADYTGAKHAVACVNGTAALHTALMVSGVCSGDEVLVPTLTFIAPINAVKYIGADPVFFDCDDYYCLDSAKVIEFIQNKTEFRNGYTYNSLTGKRISALIVVHVFGNAANLKEWVGICRERNIRVIEDSTESLGTRYLDGTHTGTVGDLGCFSFNGNKIITTGGGGMLITNNSGYAERAKYLTTQAKDDGLYYVHHEVGYNYRLTNIQAAIGLAQMEQLDDFVSKKRSFYDRYKETLEIAAVPDYAFNNCWMVALRVVERDALMKRLSEANIQARPIWALNHLQKPYLSCETYHIEKALDLMDHTLNLPCSVGMKIEDVESVMRAVR